MDMMIRFPNLGVELGYVGRSVRIFGFEITEGVNRVGRPAPVDVHARDRELRVRGRRNDRHEITMLRRGHLPSSLERLHRGRHEDHLVQVEELHHL